MEQLYTLCSNQTLVSIGADFSSFTGKEANNGNCDSSDCESLADVSESSRSFTQNCSKSGQHVTVQAHHPNYPNCTS